LTLLLFAFSAHAQIPATFARENLPSYAVAQSGKPVKCGLDDVMYIKQNRAEFSPAQRSLFKGFTERPSLPSQFISPSGIFKIHYTTTGVHRIDPTSTNNRDVPDYAWEAALAADFSYRLLVEALGFQPHLPDNNVDGPEFDIYLVDTGVYFGESYYGATTPESRVGSAFTTYTAVENDFEENFFTRGLDALRVTIAHEYFHAIHFSYNFRNEDVFFFEMSAVWFEDEAYPEINDYLQYIPRFFRTLDEPLHQKDGWHEYGASLFLKYWLATYPKMSLQKMWEGLTNKQAIRAIEDEINAQGSSFVAALAEFAGWCLFTGDRAQPGQFFDDAGLFPFVELRQQVEVLGGMTLRDSTKALTAQFYQFNVDASNDFNVSVTSNGAGKFGLAGASESVSGELGKLLVRPGSLPYSISATENEGMVLLAVVNGAAPENPSTSTSLLKREVYNLIIGLQALEPFAGGLLAPRPNPFLPDRHGSIAILYNLSERTDASLAIVSETGQRVLEKDLGRRESGIYQFVWNGKDEDDRALASGIYLVILKTSGGDKSTQKIALVR
jgi:hypothetical protein